MSVHTGRPILFLCLFFLSGAAGLIYEIVWSRMLVLVFGGTTFAITTVLACFMGGLALGSYLAGRVASRLKRPTRVYGQLELAIGAFCLLVPLLLRLATPLYGALVPLTGDSFLLLTAARVVVSASILLVPSCMMGATLPILVQGLVRGRDDLAGRIASLYGFNTIGAFAGTVTAGFLLIPAAGLLGSIWIAAGINFAVGLAALSLDRPTAGVAPTEPARNDRRDAKKTDDTEGPGLAPGLLLALYAVSGLAAMAYQVAWSRALILAMGSSTYAFSTIVACYILGLAAGSLAVSWAENRPALRRLISRRTLWIAGWLQAVIALSALFVVPLFGRMPAWVAQLARGPEATFGHVLRAEALIVFGLLFVPTFCMGALMPLVCRLYGRNRAPGRSMGDVYAANTFGTIFGAFTAGFILIPLQGIGMQNTIYIASALSAGIGSVFLLRAGPTARSWVLVGLIWTAGVTTIVLSGPWARDLMVSGPFLARRELRHSVLYYREGVDTTVAVTSSGGATRTLRVNGKPDASNSFMDMVTQLMSAHIPMLLRPGAEQVLVIGLGSGATGGAVLSYPVERVEVAEISAAVVESASFFEQINNGVLQNPRVTIHRNDGRNHLLLTDRRYDVIISEPSNPWISGVANLFTREFFELARSRLRPGGLHCQWIQGYSIEAEDVAAVLKTLGSVFAQIQLWETGFGDYLVIGSDSPIGIDLDRIYEAMARPPVALSLSQILIQDPNQIASHWIAGRDALELWIGDQRVLTDDRPYLEFAAPRFLLSSDEARIRQALLGFDQAPDLTETASAPLADEFRMAIERGHNRRRAMQGVEDAVLARDGGATLDGLLAVATWGSTDGRAMKRVGQMLVAIEAEANPALEQRVDRAAQQLRRDAPYLGAGEMNESDPATMFWPFTRNFEHDGDPEVERLELAIRRAIEERDREQMMEHARRMLERAPESWRALSTIGALLFDAEGPEAARPYLLKAWIRNPASRTVGHRLAHVYTGMNRPELAVEFLRRSIENGLPAARVAADPGLAALRDHPAFQQLIGAAR